MSSDDNLATRRALLSAAGAAALAGCVGVSSPTDPPTGGTRTVADGTATDETTTDETTTDDATTVAESDSVDWPQPGRTASHVGRVTEFTADDEPTPAWETTVEGSVTTPTVVGDAVYVTRGAPDGDRPEARLEAYALASGERRWSVPLGSRFEYNAPFSNHRPVVRGRRIHVSTTDSLVAVDARTRDVEWEVTTGASFNVPPTVTADGAYVAGRREVVAVDHEGTERWRLTGEGRVGSQLVTVHEDTVYASVGERTLGVDSATGEIRWEYASDGLSLGASAAVGDTVVRADFGRVEALSTEGTHRWSASGPDEDLLRPTVGDGTAFTLGIYGTVTAYELSSGEQSWRTAVGDGEWTQETAPVLLDGTLVAGQSDGSEVSVHGLDAESGERRWTLTAADARIRGPVVASGRLVATTQDRHVNTGSDGTADPPRATIRAYEL